MARQERAAAPRAPSTAARIADGIIEAGWLLALAFVPVFFNIQSGRPFEPDKTALLRLVAAVMAAAGLARAVESRVAGTPGEPTRWRESPLVVGALVYLGAATLSTMLSIDPRLSLWGSHSRLEGLVTLLAHFTVFVAVATRLRRRDQVDRLLDVVVAASLPVCAYGFLQRLGRDPLDWEFGDYQSWRISTTLGNPVFTGEYLLAALTMTVAAIAWWWSRRGEAGRTARLAVYGVAAVIQAVALGLTGSRGPWLGAATALAALLLLHAALRGGRRLAAATLAAGIAAAVFVGVLNIPGGPLERLRRGPLLGRLGRLFAQGDVGDPGDGGRVLAWQGALKLAHLPAPVVVPGRGPDGAAALRGLVGFGPETLHGVFGVVYDPAFARAERRNPEISAEGGSTFSTRSPDRSHNEVLDSLVFGGILGVLAHLLLHAAVQVTGLRAMGLARTKRDWVSLAALCGGAAALMTAIAGPALSWAYLGVTLPLGLVAGLFVFVLMAALRGRLMVVGPEAALVAGVAATLLGLFVSMQFGPTLVTGRLYFWALAGLLVALGRVSWDAREPAAPSTAWSVARLALPAAAIGFVIAYGFAGPKAGGGGHAAYGTIAILFGVALAAWLGSSARRWPTAAIAAAVAATLTAAYAVYQVGALADTADVRTLADLFVALAGHFSRIAVLIVAAVIAWGVALGREGGAPLDGGGLLRLGGALAVVLVLTVPSTLASVNADVYRHFAAGFVSQGRFQEGSALVEEAVRVAPGDAIHHQALGETLLSWTRVPGQEARAPELLKRAEAELRRARELEPLLPDHTTNLARLARRRSELDTDPASSRHHAEEAARAYAEVLALVPGNPLLLDETAELDYQRLGDFASAERKLLRSVEMDPTFDYTHNALGDLYMARARANGARDDYGRAAQAYEAAAAQRKSLKALVSLGIARKEMGDAAAAIRAFEEALAAPPPPSIASGINEQLAVIYSAQGDAARAQRHAAVALEQAPEKDKAPLQARLRAAGLSGP